MERVDYQSLVVQDLVNLDKRDELNLNPWYQRRSVWNNSQKSYLINTLLERKPIPAIFIRHSLDLEKSKSIKEIVDGQQRTKAILGYCKDEFTVKHPELNKKVKFSALNHMQKHNFLLTAIPIGYLQGANDSDVIDIFARINSVAKTLNAQEKRNANYSGEFKQFCLNESVKRLEFWRNYKIFTSNDIARMYEVQFISDLVIDLMDGLKSYSSRKLDKYYKNNDESYKRASETKKRLEKTFTTIIDLKPECIKETIFRRPPIFFSLFIVLESLKKINAPKIEKVLFEIDSRFNSDIPLSERSKYDIEFYKACSATTQGLEQRRARDKYIRKYIV